MKLVLTERLEKDQKTDIRTKTTVEQININSIVVQKEGEIQEIEGIDMVVLALGAASNNILADELKMESRIPEIYSVGDCVMPRKMTDAIHEGFSVGYWI